MATIVAISPTIPADCLSADNIIGSGQYGIVYTLKDDERFAIKQQFIFTGEAYVINHGIKVECVGVDEFNAEVQALKRMQDTHVTPRFHDSWIYEGSRTSGYIVMERMQGTLHQIWDTLTADEIEQILKQLTHINDVFLEKHLALIDLHMGNVLYKRNEDQIRICVGDLGILHDFTNEYADLLTKHSRKVNALRTALINHRVYASDTIPSYIPTGSERIDKRRIEYQLMQLMKHPVLTPLQVSNEEERHRLNLEIAHMAREVGRRQFYTPNRSGRDILDTYYRVTTKEVHDHFYSGYSM